MNRYRVPMARDTTEYTYVEVDADNEYQAEELAYEIARNNWDLKWEPSDYCDKPYCPDLAEIEVVEPDSVRCNELQPE